MFRGHVSRPWVSQGFRFSLDVQKPGNLGRGWERGGRAEERVVGVCAAGPGGGGGLVPRWLPVGT